MAGFAGFRTAYLNADPMRSVFTYGLHDDFCSWEASQLRYSLHWSLYQNNAFWSELHRWAPQLKTRFGLYKHTRNVFNPVYRLGEFWATHLVGGRLDTDAGDGMSSKSAIPIEGASASAQRGIAKLWRDSRWQVEKGVWSRFGPILGDVGLKVCDDPIRGEVTLKVVHPGTVRWIDRDHEGGPTKVGYGGARGGGKSHWGLAQVVADDCTRFPGLKALYLRKVGKAGREAIQDLRREVLHSVPHEYKIQDNMLVLPNGSRVVLGHFQSEKDIDNYLGLQYDLALIEEGTQLSSRKIKDIGTCVRSSKPGWRPRQYFTTNPGNIGHAWFKAMFIDPMRSGVEKETRFIQATVRDNSFVNPEYRSELESLTGWQRQAWLDGSWDIAAGQYFVTWRHAAHVVPAFTAENPLPRHWRVWLGFDYGFVHYTAVYLLAQDGDGNIYIVDEHADRGWLPQRHAAAVFAMLARHEVDPCRIEAIAAGWDCFNKDRYGKSIADDYQDLGLVLDRADADRINGAAEILKRLGDPEATPPIKPRLFVSSACTRLIDCIPSLQHDPHRGEDVLKVDCDDDGLGGDDPYDAVRYGVMHAATDHTIRVGPNPFGSGRV